MNDSRLLASKELLEQIPDLDEQMNAFVHKFLLVHMQNVDTGFELSGPAASISIANNPEVSLKTELSQATTILRDKESITIHKINVMHDNVLATFEGNFCIEAVKISDINVEQQSCVLVLGLKHSTKNALFG